MVSRERNEALRWLAWAMGIVVAAPVAGWLLRSAGGPMAAAGTWLPFAVMTIFLIAGAARLSRAVPGVWARPVPGILNPDLGIARATALNGLLVAVTVLLVLSRRLIPLAGQALFWFSALPVMLGVAIAPTWGLLGYLTDILLLVLLGRPVTALLFGLFTGLIGLVGGVASVRRASWLSMLLWCAAVEIPAQAVLLTALNTGLMWMRPDLHQNSGLALLMATSLLVGAGWTLTAMPLFPRIAAVLPASRAAARAPAAL